MAGKSLAIGEAGILVTDDVEIYERAVAFGFYERAKGEFETQYLNEFAGLPACSSSITTSEARKSARR